MSTRLKFIISEIIAGAAVALSLFFPVQVAAQCFGPVGCADKERLNRNELAQLDCSVLAQIRTQIYVQQRSSGQLDPKSIAGLNAALVRDVEHQKGCPTY